MTITQDFRRITQRLDEALAAAWELENGKRKRSRARKAALGTGLTKLEQKVLVKLRGALHPHIVELAAVAAGAVWPTMYVSAFLSRLDLLGRYPKAVARQARLSGHEIDGVLLATSGHMAYASARGAGVALHVGGRTRRFATVQAFLRFIAEDVDERWEGTHELLEQARAKQGGVSKKELARAESIVDFIVDPPAPRSAAGKAYARLEALRMFGPEGELADTFLNEAPASFLAAARFAKLTELEELVDGLCRALPGKTWSARAKQAERESAADAIAAVEEWTDAHADALTVALAKIALDAGWVK